MCVFLIIILIHVLIFICMCTRPSFMDIIRTRQKNWIGYILRGNSLQREIMEGRMEGKRGRGRNRQKLMDWMMGDGGWILETQGKGTTSRRMESLDIWTWRQIT